MQRVFWCSCGQKMKVPPEYIGRSGRCVNCQRRVTLTEENTYPPGQQAPAGAGAVHDSEEALAASITIPPLNTGPSTQLPPIEELPPEQASRFTDTPAPGPPPGPFVEADAAPAALPPLAAPPPEAPPPSDGPHSGIPGEFLSTPLMDHPPGPPMDTPPTPVPWQVTPEDVMTPCAAGVSLASRFSPVLTDTPSAAGVVQASKRDHSPGEADAAKNILPDGESPFDAAVQTWRLVLEPQRLILAALATMVCATGTLILSTFFRDIVQAAGGRLAASMGGCVTALWIAAWLGIVAGGVAWMVRFEEDKGRRPGCLEGLSFAASRSLGLASVLPAFALVLIVLAAAVNGGLKLLAELPWAGPSAVGLMSVPVFAGLTALLLCAVLALMVPCVMATDGVPAVEAARRVVALFRGRGRSAISHYLMAVFAALPLLLAMGALGSAGWHITRRACAGAGADDSVMQMSSYFVAALWAAFWVVYAAVTHTIVYRGQGRRRASVDGAKPPRPAE